VSFLGELKRRNVFRVAGVYAVVGWLLMQVAASLEEAVGLPEWFDGLVVSLLVVFFPIALIAAWAFELTPDGIKRTAAVDAGDSITAHTAGKLDMVLVVALLVFSGAILAPRFLGEGDSSDVGGVAETAARAEDAAAAAAGAESTDPNAPPPASIAVMPFADLSQRGDQEYFADGISEELLNLLAKVESLKVAGRMSSFSFKGRNEELTEVGRILNVAHILEGSVRSQGDRVRVTAQLIQVSDGYHLWSETYDGNLSDIFAVQDDIAQQILVALKERLIVGQTPELAQSTRTDVTAYGLFLEARDLIYTRDEGKLTRAKALLDQVISIDPEYAPSYALRAKAYLMLSDRPSSYGKMPVDEAVRKAEIDVATALELDPELADAHAVRGLLNSDIGNPDFAVASLRRSLALNPNSLDARNWLAISLVNMGRMREAVDELAVLRDIDPLFPPAVNNAMVFSAELGDYKGAIAIAERFAGLTSDPAIAIEYRGRIADIEGRTADALMLWEQTPKVDRGRARVGSIVGAYGALGEDPRDHGSDAFTPRGRADLRARLGEFDEALRLAETELQRAPDQVSVQNSYINVLNLTQKHQRLIDFFETQFEGSLSLYATRLRTQNINVPPPFRALALAARATGDEVLYQETMLRWRESIDAFRAGGSADWAFDLIDALYWALRDDASVSIDFLESAFAKRITMPFFWFSAPEFDALRDHPRFVALRNKNAERINLERNKMGWDPLPADVIEYGFGGKPQ
jgi:TolB-like protein/tetratricopeptide (TPR) repeat protein